MRASHVKTVVLLIVIFALLVTLGACRGESSGETGNSVSQTTDSALTSLPDGTELQYIPSTKASPVSIIRDGELTEYDFITAEAEHAEYLTDVDRIYIRVSKSVPGDSTSMT